MTDREKTIKETMPMHWDKGPYSIACELKDMMQGMIDAGSGIDTGVCEDTAHLWATIDGVEYFIELKQSNAEIIKAPEASQYTAFWPKEDMTGPARAYPTANEP